MINIFSTILMVCMTSITVIAQFETAISVSLPEYIPNNLELQDIIVQLDSKFFGAYNSCDSVVLEEMIAEDLEFYHDQVGLSTSKAQIIQALKDNICNKVTRKLIEGTIEVYPIPGYGAIQMGWHQFHNSQESNVIPKPSKFVTIWKQKGDEWLMARVISLH